MENTRLMRSRSLIFVLPVLAMACSGSERASNDDNSTADAGPVELCEKHEVACIDEQISGLDLFSGIAKGVITEEGQSADEFTSSVDARGGGLSPSESFVYARFEKDGLKKVDLSDEAAFESDEWHIAFRRYVVRINSGLGGPSCVTVGRTAPGTSFEDLTSAPDDLTYREEQYMTDSCEVVPDGSGIGAPATAMASFWSYESCVQMTGNVYVVQLNDGRRVKAQVLSYYSPSAQETCNNTGSAPSPSGAGQIRIRWAFLP